MEKMGAIQHYVMMVLTGQAHLLQHMEETHDVLQKTRADVELLKTMYQELLELIHAESGQTVEEACSPMESRRNPRGRKAPGNATLLECDRSRAGVVPANA